MKLNSVQLFPPVSMRAVVSHNLQALRFDPDNSEIWHRLGDALAQLGDRAGALTALRNALLLDGARTDTQLALGKLLFDCGQLDHALVYFAGASMARGER